MAGLSGDPNLGVGDKIERLQYNNNSSNVAVDKEGLEGIGEESNSNNKNNQGGEKDMAGNSIHRSGSRPQLDLSKAEIQGNSEERHPAILLPNQSDDISHLALDIGGSLIKLVYFSRHEDQAVEDKRKKTVKERLGILNGNRRSYPVLGGRLHFVKFETSKLNECLDFISSKQLHCGRIDSHHWNSEAPANENAVIKADWEILMKIMSKMGFGDRWCSGYLSGVNYFHFDPSELLHLLLVKAVDKGLFSGFELGAHERSFMLSHLQFADDRIIFSNATIRDLLNEEVLASWAKEIGCSMGYFPSEYLGLPLGAKRNSFALWEPVVQKFYNSLAEWKAKSLSLAGRVVLFFYGEVRQRKGTFIRKNICLRIGNEAMECWHDVWLGLVPLKDRFPRLFALSNNKGRVAVKAELLKRGVTGIDDLLCPMCGKCEEPVSHMFLHCEVVWDLWNEIIFQNGKVDIALLFFLARFRTASWWVSPPEGFLKLNVDGAMDRGWEKGRICGLIRDARVLGESFSYCCGRKGDYFKNILRSANWEADELAKAGGGAYKFADLFKERLGVSIEKEDEMDCLVAGANFLLKAIRHEAFTHMEGRKEFVQIDHNDMFPYLLVNVGSGISIIKVDGDGKFQRVSGTNVGGGTYWGLGRLLTKCNSFDELLELSQRGDNSTIDMLVGDIYGGMDYSKIGLSASTIASSFGKAISDKKELEDYRPEDISLSLLRMISYNIGQISYLNALQFGLKRIFFGGFFIRGHAYTMDTISFAVQFWSKGEAQAMFLRHEGFLGALGAFMSYQKHGLDDLLISWMEKFVQKGTEITAPVPMAPPGTTGLGGFEVPSSKGATLRSDASALNVGVLHLVPTLEVFPLLTNPKMYEPNTIDLSDHKELEYWFTVLSEHLPDLVDKAVASEGGTDDAKRRGDAFARAFSAHLARLMEEPAAYGKLGLANLLELREECLREFQFHDAYRSIKQSHNNSQIPNAIAQNSTSPLDLATTSCFSLLQVAKFPPKKVQYPEVDLLSIMDPA
ncbi:Pantothenate kinase 2 [Hibiscus syriacus]|uniref:pantothenate kinase n=1 Tax=Hibiscus syriacus TaxID=106335 RepID=A0A6A3CC70_HIBSY|nr:Pantothenate kinase 2 [Hibiscus syriacus]